MSKSQSTLPTSETIRVLHDRVSVRRYTDAPVSDDHVQAILKAAFRAPTSSNIQSYSVVVVRDPETKAQLSLTAGGQRHVAEAPVFLAFCADLTRIDVALQRNGHDLNDNNLEVGLVSSIDAALVGMSAYLAADSLGIKGVMIGAMRNDPVAAARLLDLPHRVYCVFGMCLGWPAEAPAQKPRMDFDHVVHFERYDAGKSAAAVDAYDPVLASHYRASGRQTTDDSWSHDIDAKFHPPQRDTLRQALKSLGFDFR
jgi:nitroreductase